MKQLLDRLSGFGERRPRLTLIAFLVLALACAGVSLSLEPSTNVNTFVNSSSTDYQATQLDSRQFGGEAVDVLVRGPLTTLVATKDLEALANLEACLGGNELKASTYFYNQVPAATAKPYGGADSPCGHLMAAQPVQVVYGPATFLNQAVAAVDNGLSTYLNDDKAAISELEQKAIQAAKAKGLSKTQQEQLAQEVAEIVEGHDESELLTLAEKAGLTGLTIPSISDASFIHKIVFSSTTSSTPKARFSYLFPTADSELIQVRLKPNLTTAQTARAIGWIKEATRMKQFALGGGASFLVSGEPVVLNDVSASLSGQIVLLLVGAVVVMAAVLLLVFRRRLRLLPLALALASAAITFGVCAVAGGTLTLASIAVLPILIGLAVDYGIQFQSRASGAPTIAAAALATATGFLVLLLSPVPMVRGFGLLLVLGVGVAFIVVLCAGSAVLALAGGDRSTDGTRGTGDAPSRSASLPGPMRSVAQAFGEAGQLLLVPVLALGRLLAPSLRGARDILVPRRVLSAGDSAGSRPAAATGEGLGAVLARLSARPRTIVIVGLILAAAGWVADTQTSVQSDITKLVPSNTAALRNLLTLEHVTGESGELDVVIHASNVATPAVIGWMEKYESQITSHFGYNENAGCNNAATVCPALSLPDLFASVSSSGSTKSASATLTQASINTLLDAVPSYFSSAVITQNRTYAALTFGIRLMPLSKQIRVVAYMRNHLDPPAGVTAQLAGLPVLAADADQSLSSSGRRLLTLVAGIVAVALMLMAIFRRPKRALIPLVPIVLATGWSALIVWAIGIPLNPMSATLGALVIAISTEFSVLLAERFRRQRAEGESAADALASAYRSTGRAVVASGITAIAGFAVLIVSNVVMLQDFGLVTLIDMTVSLLGVLAVLPAVLTLSEGGKQRAMSSESSMPRPEAPRASLQPGSGVPV